MNSLCKTEENIRPLAHMSFLSVTEVLERSKMGRQVLVSIKVVWIIAFSLRNNVIFSCPGCKSNFMLEQMYSSNISSIETEKFQNDLYRVLKLKLVRRVLITESGARWKVIHLIHFLVRLFC